MKVCIIGAGRAGRSLYLALSEAGLEVDLLPARSDSSLLRAASKGRDVVLLAVADRYVTRMAAAIEPDPRCAVLHCSGSLGLEVLAPHERRGSLHPLATLPDPVVGALRLQGGTYFAVSGDQRATDLALALRGKPIVVDPSKRAAYHAAASVAANHLVALLGQVERIAATAGLPLEAFLPLARGALDDVTMLGARAALTGPASRGDIATIESHRAALPPGELASYETGVELCRRLVAEEPEPAAAGSPWS